MEQCACDFCLRAKMVPEQVDRPPVGCASAKCDAAYDNDPRSTFTKRTDSLLSRLFGTVGTRSLAERQRD